MYRIPGCCCSPWERFPVTKPFGFVLWGRITAAWSKKLKRKCFLLKKNRRTELQLFGKVGFRLWTKRDREWVFQMAEQRIIICRQTALRLFSHMGIDRTWQSFAVKICQRDTFPSYTLTFLDWNLSRHLPKVSRKIGKKIRDAEGLGWGKEKRLETLWGKKREVKWQRVAVFTIIERVTEDRCNLGYFLMQEKTDQLKNFRLK